MDSEPFISQSLSLTAPQELAWQENLLLDPGPNELLVATTTGSVSLGTELPLYEETLVATALPAWFAKMATTVERPIKVLVQYDQQRSPQ